MFYNFAVTVLAGTTKDDPKEQELNLTHGFVHRIEVDFPFGCRGYVYLVIFHRLQQKWPTNIDEAFHAEGYTVPIDEHFDLTEPPHTLLVRAWSPECIHDHRIAVRVGILPEAALAPLTGLGAMLAKFFRVLGVR